MKKALYLLGLTLLGFTMIACRGKTKLYVLNWGQYISTDLIHTFEKENNVKVVYNVAVSNELMYDNVAQRRAPYDIVFPSDYMIEKMKAEDLIQKIDVSLLENYEEDMFVPELKALMESEGVVAYKDYYIPYFWGSLGIMYSNKKPNTKELVEEYGWSILFDKEKNSGLNVGMYASSRDSFAAALLAQGESVNTKDRTKLEASAKLLKESRFAQWGDDELKTNVVRGSLDIALVYSGDFFDAYYTSLDNEKEIDFGLYAPQENNNVFFDGMVIPTTSRQTELAHKFIDFMIDHENSLENAYYVGYCPVLNSVYQAVVADEEMADIVAIDGYHPQKIVIAAKEKAEVYLDLGKDTYKFLEELYEGVRTK